MAAAVPAYHSSTPSFRRHYRDRLRAVPLALVLVVGVLAAPQATTTCALLRVELPPKLASWPCLTSRRPRDEALALPLRLRGAGPSQEDGEEDLHESVGQADGDEKDPTAFNVAEEEMMSKIDRLNLRARGDADKLEPVRHRARPDAHTSNSLNAELGRIDASVRVYSDSGWPTILKLTCRACGTNSSTLGRKRAWSHQIGETK
jgi:hypothetical protein